MSVLPQKFSESWTLADTVDYLATLVPSCDREDFKAMEDWRQNTVRPVDERLEQALMGHLLDLSRRERLQLPENCEGISPSWLYGWRALMNGTLNELSVRVIASELNKMVHFLVFDLEPSTLASSDTVLAIHERLHRCVREGNFSHLRLDTCCITNQSFQLKLENWMPVVGVYDRELKTVVALKPGEYPVLGVDHWTIPVPSGELWVTDGFRIEAFNQLVKDAVNRPFFYTHENGFRHFTQVCAEQLGFAQVPTRSSSPDIYELGARFMGGVAEASVAGQALGPIGDDFGWRIFIDKAVLSNLLRETVGEEGAQAALADCEKNQAVVKVSVPPGTYHLYASAAPRFFKEAFASEEVSFEGFSEPHFVLSPDPLTLLKKPSLSPGRKRCSI